MEKNWEKSVWCSERKIFSQKVDDDDEKKDFDIRFWQFSGQ